MQSLTAVLVTHRSAPLAVLERMPRGDALPAAITDVVSGLAANGAVGLSTCNRFEVYLDAPAPIDPAALIDRLHGRTGVDRPALAGCLDILAGEPAARHLFAVAAGLDSRLLGEEEILGQVRTAAREAQRGGTASPGLTALFAWAVRTGRRARRAAGLAEGRISLADRAVDVLEQRLTSLQGRTVLLLGSGQMAGRVLTGLGRAGARPILLVRRPEAVASTSATVLGLDELPRVIDGADAVLCATSAPRPLLDAALLARAAARRGGRPPLLVVDLAVPRNVETPGGDLEGVCVLDLDALADAGAAAGFDGAARRALAVVGVEARAFCARRDRSAAGPLIEQVLRHGEDIRRAELARAARLAPAVDRQFLDELTARVVQKVLHAPITAIREHAGAGEGELAALIATSLAGAGAPTAHSGQAVRR